MPDMKSLIPEITEEQKNSILDEFDSIASSLESLNGVFCQFWQMGKPTLTYEISTAAVGFNREGACIEFRLNPLFWETLNYNTKLFLICHECMHVILNHGSRANDSLRGEDRDAIENPMTQVEDSLANIAMDVTINEALVNHFGFSRSSINFKDAIDAVDKFYTDLAKKMGTYKEDAKHPLGGEELERINLEGSFVDTVFHKIKPDIEYGKSYEYYQKVLVEYFEEKIQEEKDENARNEMIRQLLRELAKNAIDNHDSLSELSGDPDGGDASDEPSKSPGERIVDDVIKNAEKDDLEELKEGMETGFGKGHPGEPLIEGALKAKIEINYKNVRKLRKWQDLFKKYVKRKQEEAEESQWSKPARRYAMLPDDFLLPSIDESEDRSEKFYVWLFIDSSGSCYHLKDQFFKAAYSMDLRYFDVKVFSRNTTVRELDYHKPEVRGYGSDDFRCIENYIQKQLREKKISKYPEIVMHFTDGHDCSGVMVKPQKPLNWYWFLTDEMHNRWIPKECIEANRVFKLSEFES